MTTSLYELYNSYEKQELFKILLSPEDYQAQAIEISKRILKEKDWTTEFKKVRTKNKEQLRKEIEEKAGYYRKAVDFQEQKNSFQVRIADVPKLEGALIENNIDFFREDKNVGVQLDSYPTQTYYFKDADLK